MSQTTDRTISISIIQFIFIFIITFLFFNISKHSNELIEKEEKVKTILELSHEYYDNTNNLTKFARAYVSTTDKKYKDIFFSIIKIRNGEIARPDDYSHLYWSLNNTFKKENNPQTIKISLENKLKKFDLLDKEKELLSLSQKESEKLTKLELKTFDMIEKNNYSLESKNQALDILFSKEYEESKLKVIEPLKDFENKVLKRLYDEEYTLENEMKIYNFYLKMIILTFILVNLLIYNYIHKINKKYNKYLEKVIDDKTIELTNLNIELENKIKEATENILEKEKFLAKLIETIPAPIFAKDKDLKYNYCNKAFLDFLGKNKEDIIGKDVWELSPEDLAQKYHEADLQIIKDKHQVYESHVVYSDGSRHQIQFHKSVYTDNFGEFAGIIGFIIDNTEKINLINEIKKTNENLEEKIKERTINLEESEAFLKNIMESALDGIITINEKGIIQTFNKAAEELFGYERDEVIGKNVSMIIPQPHAINHDRYIQNYLDTGISKILGKTLEQETIKKDGSIVPISIRVGEIEFGDKKIFTALIQDISERKKTEKEFIKAKEKAEEATKAKSYFLANMSHEIRTPMNGIIGMTNLALNTELSQQQKHYINRINTSAQSLLGIINDILDISKIEAGKFNIEESKFDLFETVENVINMVEARIYDKGLGLIVDFDTNLAKEYLGDSLRINQILTNLLSNAVKFTNKGDIFIGINKINEQKIHVEIKDTGIGLNQEQLENIFNSFTQADGSTTKKYGGTGLGLSISKNLVELMNGTIWVDSQIGVGSSFNFEIELKELTLHKDLNKFDNKSILIVDDNHTWLNILEKYFRYFNMDVTLLDNGKDTLKLLEKDKDKFDVILIDWNMPELNGLEVSKILHNDYKIDNNKIILLSGHNKDILNDEMKEAHISKFLHKPFSLNIINSLLKEIILGIKSDKKDLNDIKNSNIEEQMNNLKDSKILLVEDNNINQEVVVTMLSKYSINIDIANNGLEAIQMFKANNYDLILMDIQMPIIDGYEATRQIRQINKDIVIIALSANAMKEDIEKSIKSGMNDHIVKPINIQKLYETLLKYLSKENIQDDTNNIINIDVESSDKNILPEFKTFDKEAGLKLVMGIETIYIEYLKGLSKYDNLDYENMDSEEFKRTMHSIKGLSASIGANDLSQLALQLERNRDSGLLEEYKEKITLIVKEITDFFDTLKIEKENVNDEKIDELFLELKNAISTKRIVNCKPIIEEISTIVLDESKEEFFFKIKDLLEKFQFKKALELYDE